MNNINPETLEDHEKQSKADASLELEDILILVFIKHQMKDAAPRLQREFHSYLMTDVNDSASNIRSSELSGSAKLNSSFYQSELLEKEEQEN